MGRSKILMVYFTIETIKWQWSMRRWFLKDKICATLYVCTLDSKTIVTNRSKMSFLPKEPLVVHLHTTGRTLQPLWSGITYLRAGYVTGELWASWWGSHSVNNRRLANIYSDPVTEVWRLIQDSVWCFICLAETMVSLDICHMVSTLLQEILERVMNQHRTSQTPVIEYSGYF